jgi:hypothetical protein
MNFNENESYSITMDLENLRQKYSNLLIQYKSAVADYVNYLNVQSQQPCGNFTANSKGIDQKCYEYIWKKSGCGAGNVQPIADGSWASNQTLNDLITDSWYWATLTDYTHRMGCYGNPGYSYIILGVGTDRNLWSRQGLDATWQRINDNSNSGVVAIFTGNDAKTIYCTNINGEITYKSSWDAPTWQVPISNSCCVISAAMGQDGTIVGVGTDNKLWSRPLNGYWSQTASPGEWCASVAIAPDGSVFVVGGGNQIWKKNSYKNLASQSWVSQGSCCLKAITIAPDGTFIGVGTDNQLWTKASYKDLTTSWQGPYNSSCCVTSITTIPNPNYNASNFNMTSAPNYKINNEELVTIQGQAFNGTGSAGQSTATTLQDCVASCTSSDTCTGATFVSNKCEIRTGDSPMVPSTQDSYAIIPKGKQLLLNMEDINQQLLDVNKQLVSKIQVSEPVFDKFNNDTKSKNQELIQNYKSLLEERRNIAKILNEYETLDNTENENLIKIDQNYYSYILLLILLVALIILLYKMFSTTTPAPASPLQYRGELGINAYYIVFGFIIFVIILNFGIKYLSV